MTQNNYDLGHNDGFRVQVTSEDYPSQRSAPHLRASSSKNDIPIGIKLLKKLLLKNISKDQKRIFFKTSVLILTFIAYAAYHLGRRPLSIVKNALHQENQTQTQTHSANYEIDQLNEQNNLKIDDTLAIAKPSSNQSDTNRYITISNQDKASILSNQKQEQSNWAPFDNDQTAEELLAILDSAFLASYALGMFFSGFIAERTNLRHFLVIGCTLSGLGLIASGLAHKLEIHSLGYFIVTQIFSGIAQSTGWPIVVTCIGNWFAKSERNLIFGLWNSHTNLGNILGAIVAGSFVGSDWGLSFIVPGFIMIFVATIMFLFLVPNPDDLEMSSEKNQIMNEFEPVSRADRLNENVRKHSESHSSISSLDNVSRGEESNRDNVSEPSKAVSFLQALMIPGVIEYSISFFFSKMVSYTFLYWLPKYIASSTSRNTKNSAFLSIWLDVGGAVGAIFASFLSDIFETNGLICTSMLLASMPAMFAYQKYGSISTFNDVVLQFLVGAFVNGPYCLITTSVSTDLGDRIKDGRAVATVAAIIDGMGSIGAVVGPLLAGFLFHYGGWKPVFIVLIVANALSAICLGRISINELRKYT